jgi:hypothetical protein
MFLKWVCELQISIGHKYSRQHVCPHHALRKSFAVSNTVGTIYYNLLNRATMTKMAS